VSRTIVLLAAAAIGLIRAGHSLRASRPVVARRGGVADAIALTVSVIGFVVPIVWAAGDRVAFADFEPVAPLVVTGAVIQALALYLFHRAHVDLGPNWSSQVQLFERHQMITTGVYSRVRHPMYLALILFGVGQALVVPNWVAAPACLVGNTVLYLARVTKEEEMMRARFGAAYDAYAARAGKLIPRV